MWFKYLRGFFVQFDQAERKRKINYVIQQI